ncbi:MAG: DUF480 domain-containing protein [Propionibacteriaceae bacterium]|nr:DUF480 domain-containing protein [Propionibacteriaceae bacterium]
MPDHQSQNAGHPLPDHSPPAQSLPDLSPVDQRILGALMEKQRTVPGSYPLSLNAVRTACNQTSNRDPVTDYTDHDLETQLQDLKHRELIKVVWTGRPARTLKYHQLLTDRLGLAPDEAAILTVLLLRGAQAPGELKTRTERLHPFGDRGAVEDCLHQLAGRSVPLVRQLDRKVGQHDHRWVHLLGSSESEESAPATPAPDRDSVLAGGAAARDARVIEAYDAVAEAYLAQFGGELDHKPFDRWLLRRIATQAPGPVADVGCGPGHTTHWLATAGADVTGFDLSPQMVATAQAAYPEVTFRTGDLTKLLRPPTAAAWGAITAWYALVHLAESELSTALTSLARVLAPGGWLVLALHAGNEIRHTDELLGHPVNLDFVLHNPNAVLRAVGEAGLETVERYVRGPQAGLEVATDRLYVMARKPA